MRKSPTKAYAQRQDYLVLQDFKGYNRIDHYEKQSKVCEGNFMQNEVEVTVCPSFLSRNELCLNTQNEIDWSSEHSVICLKLKGISYNQHLMLKMLLV